MLGEEEVRERGGIEGQRCGGRGKEEGGVVVVGGGGGGGGQISQPKNHCGVR